MCEWRLSPDWAALKRRAAGERLELAWVHLNAAIKSRMDLRRYVLATGRGGAAASVELLQPSAREGAA